MKIPLELISINYYDIYYLTNRITWLTEDFQKVSYPPIKSIEEENKRIEALKKQLGWGATGMEVPPLPESKRGLKFHAAAEELNKISDEFFALRNHNPQYLKLLEEIRKEIKEYKDGLEDSQELEMTFIKEIKKLGFKCLEVSNYTGFPEILDGRIKTLHPKIYSGILSNRKKKSHLIDLKKIFAYMDTLSLIYLKRIILNFTKKKLNKLKKFIKNLFLLRQVFQLIR